jgi:hypothetical protein
MLRSIVQASLLFDTLSTPLDKILGFPDLRLAFIPLNASAIVFISAIEKVPYCNGLLKVMLDVWLPDLAVCHFVLFHPIPSFAAVHGRSCYKSDTVVKASLLYDHHCIVCFHLVCICWFLGASVQLDCLVVLSWLGY